MKCCIMLHFIWVFTVCKSTPYGVSRIKSVSFFNPLYNSDSFMRTLTNSEDSDEMPHHEVFLLGLHCLPRQKQSSEKYNSILEIITWDHSIYILLNKSLARINKD